MMRSLYSGVSGLRNHQTRMDVIGNNIANVNTVGFKASRTIFQDMYSQNVKTASSPGETTGGTNPQQIGLGMSLSTIDTLFTRSAAQTTGATYDLMIQNDGFFVVQNGTEEYYTRAGNFYEDKEHYLVTGAGFYLQGYLSNILTGADPTPSQMTNIISTFPMNGVVIPAESPTIQSGYNSSVFLGLSFNGNSDPADNLAHAPGVAGDPADPFDGATKNGAVYTVQYLPGSNEVVISEQLPGGASAEIYRETLAVTPGPGEDPIRIPAGTGKTVNGLSFSLPGNFDTSPTSPLVTTGLTITLNTDGVAAEGGGPDGITSAVSKDMGADNNGYTYQFVLDDPSKRQIRMIARDPSGEIVSTTPATLPPPTADPQTISIGDLDIELPANYDIYDINGLEIETGNQGVDAETIGEPTSIVTNNMGRIYIDENLYNVAIDKNGNITALARNNGFILDPVTGAQVEVAADQRVTIGRVAVATFDNQQALEKVGENLYRTTSNTGEATYSSPGTNGAGALNPNALEMSNVDLAQEFTDMIVTQRGFQANSRIITVSDTLLEELINLKR